jgi:hypothetical protein
MTVDTYRRGKVVVAARKAVAKAYNDFVTAEKRNQLDRAESSLHDLYQSLDILHEILRSRKDAATGVVSGTTSKPTVKIKVAAKKSKAAAAGPGTFSTERDAESKSGGVRKPGVGDDTE